MLDYKNPLRIIQKLLLSLLPYFRYHLKTLDIQIFVNEQGTLGLGALFKLRYIFNICYYNCVIICSFRLCYFELHFNLNSHDCITPKPLGPVHSNQIYTSSCITVPWGIVQGSGSETFLKPTYSCFQFGQMLGLWGWGQCQ